jgi:hypothetical protein
VTCWSIFGRVDTLGQWPANDHWLLSPGSCPMLSITGGLRARGTGRQRRGVSFRAECDPLDKGLIT